MSSVKTNSFAWTKDVEKHVKDHVAKYPKGKQQSAVMPLLDLAQRQNGGWLSQDCIEYVASYLDMPPMKVMEVATFYTMYNLKPIGKHHVQVCGTTPCWLRGSDQIMAACSKKLGIKKGQTTADGMFTLSEVECQGACVNAPMVMIDDDFFEDLTAETIEAILQSYADGKTPKAGPQNSRHSSEPEGGVTTLKAMGSAK